MGERREVILSKRVQMQLMGMSPEAREEILAAIEMIATADDPMQLPGTRPLEPEEMVDLGDELEEDPEIYDA